MNDKQVPPSVGEFAIGERDQLLARVDELKAWKSEEMEVMTPLLDYARSVCQGPLGCSITEWLLSDHKRLAELAALKAQPGGVVLPDHERAKLVNALRDCAKTYSGTDQLRAQIAIVLGQFMPLNSSPVSAGDTLGKCPECEDRIACEAGSIAMYSTLAAALKRLTFAARTSGGTAGPDAELMAACAQAEDALSMGSAGRAFMEAAGKTPSFAQENAAFEEWRKLQMSVLSEEGAAAFYRLGSVQWSGWQARASLSAPSHGEQVRDGWQLVPFEPTREMISAASGAITTPDDMPPVGAGRWSMSDIAFRSRYRAALAATPSAGSQEKG